MGSLAHRAFPVERQYRIAGLFWLEETLRIAESNHNLTEALNHRPKNLEPFKHLQGW